MKQKIKLYRPHAGQKQLHASDARFRIACCGRRFGKTMMAVNELVKSMWENPGTKGYWVAPTYRQSRLSYTMITKRFNKIISKSTLNPMHITFINNSVITFASADNSGSLRGDNAHFMVIDEASTVDDDAWSNVLRPMLTDTNGKAIIISTPFGMNWFHALFCRGQDPEYPEYESFTFPTSSNPYIPASEIEEVKRSLPADVFRQEYLAEFLESGGQVFKDVLSCVKGTVEQFREGNQYVIGVDFGKHSDFSVFIVMNIRSGHVVRMERINRVDYTVQLDKLEKLAKEYKASILMDSTGVGDPLVEQVKAKHLNAEGYLFTNKSKQQLIEHLVVLIERQEISFPNLKVLINELSSYQYHITRAGSMVYNAPTGAGYHDDCVVALALAAWGAKHTKNPMVRNIF